MMSQMAIVHLDCGYKLLSEVMTMSQECNDFRQPEGQHKRGFIALTNYIIQVDLRGIIQCSRE